MGAPVGPSNPLPFLRDANWNRTLYDGGLLPNELEGYGAQTGRRVLPYTMQDGYTREKRPMELKTVVLENGGLRATFLPEYGGRLYSLYDKKLGRELLYVNPIFQSANLAVRNAWFSGGVEWNLGQFGHTALTCEPVFFARCRAQDGEEFLRMYEYERMKGFFLQIDFHLHEESNMLLAHVALHNSHGAQSSLYWWSNTAVELNRRVRVLSGTPEVIITKPSGGVFDTCCHDTLPELNELPGMDATYPGGYRYSTEYFFQNGPTCKEAWEAAAYDDGSVFFERSTARMPYRKMFCWSAREGGRHWQEFLSEPGAPHYLEIQSGLYPTQIHGGDAPAKAVIRFTQAFGGADTDTRRTHCAEWGKACDYVYTLLDEKLPEQKLLELDARFAALGGAPPGELLHLGGGYGALENRREPGIVPKGLLFPEETMGREQRPWLSLLETGKLPPFENDLPQSYMCDPRWQRLMRGALEKTRQPELLLHYGVACYENGETAEAEAALGEAVRAWETPVTLFTLAALKRAMGDLDAALALSRRAQERWRAADLSPAFAKEHLALCVQAERYNEAWAYYRSLPEALRELSAMRLTAAAAAYETGNRDFLERQFHTEFETIREGESRITELWFRVQAREWMRESGCGFKEAFEHVQKTLRPPYEIEFRTYTEYGEA